MQFPSIGAVSAALQTRLSSLTVSPDLPDKWFHEVRICSLSGYKNIFGLLPDLTVFPAAVISCSKIGYPEPGAIRELELAVIVIDEFRSAPNQALDSCKLLDCVSESLTGTTPGAALPLAGAHLMPVECSPLELDSAHTAWRFTIKATAGFI